MVQVISMIYRRVEYFDFFPTQTVFLGSTVEYIPLLNFKSYSTTVPPSIFHFSFFMF